LIIKSASCGVAIAIDSYIYNRQDAKLAKKKIEIDSEFSILPFLLGGLGVLAVEMTTD
jgi:hypothetical protein